LAAAGCSGGLSMPALAPAEAGKQALAEYDKNGDGLLDAKELEACPALKKSLKTIDANGDGRLSAEEIADRVQSYLDARVALTAVTCTVIYNGQPLEGATVLFEPEKFMGTGVKQASGVTDVNGAADLRADGESLEGAHFGFYRVRISKKDAQGRETIPTHYNSATVLGQEIAPFNKTGKKKGGKGGALDDDNFTFFLTGK
jgi:hypothetical protein